MDESDFPSNSRTHRSNSRDSGTDDKKVEKVVTGTVTTRKPPLLRRFRETFVAEDTTSVGRYLIFDVLVPAFKDLVSDIVSQGVDRTLFGGGRSGRGRPGYRPNPSAGHVSYNRVSSSSSPPWRRDEERTPMSNRGRRMHDFKEILLATRAEAEEVIDRLFELASRYEQATVSDLYDLVGLESKYTDEKWGWRDLRGSTVVRVSGGYLLDLPQPESLN